jgi:hypothetical protein
MKTKKNTPSSLIPHKPSVYECVGITFDLFLLVLHIFRLHGVVNDVLFYIFSIIRMYSLTTRVKGLFDILSMQKDTGCSDGTAYYSLLQPKHPIVIGTSSVRLSTYLHRLSCIHGYSGVTFDIFMLISHLFTSLCGDDDMHGNVSYYVYQIILYMYRISVRDNEKTCRGVINDISKRYLYLDNLQVLLKTTHTLTGRYTSSSSPPSPLSSSSSFSYKNLNVNAYCLLLSRPVSLCDDLKGIDTYVIPSLLSPKFMGANLMLVEGGTSSFNQKWNEKTIILNLVSMEMISRLSASHFRLPSPPPRVVFKKLYEKRVDYAHFIERNACDTMTFTILCDSFPYPSIIFDSFGSLIEERLFLRTKENGWISDLLPPSICAKCGLVSKLKREGDTLVCKGHSSNECTLNAIYDATNRFSSGGVGGLCYKINDDILSMKINEFDDMVIACNEFVREKGILEKLRVDFPLLPFPGAYSDCLFYSDGTPYRVSNGLQPSSSVERSQLLYHYQDRLKELLRNDDEAEST